jgi:hypothetical protein
MAAIDSSSQRALASAVINTVYYPVGKKVTEGEIVNAGLVINSLLSNSEEGAKIKMRMLVALGEGSPESVMEFLEHSTWFNEDQLFNVRGSVIGRIAQKNGPEKALEIAGEFGVSPEAAVEHWIHLDVKEAYEWVSDQPREVQAKVAAPFAKRALQLMEIEAAREWMAKIEDGESKRELEDKLLVIERGMVRKGVEENPQLMLNKLINGNSLHHEPWIDEAFQTWARDDLGSAESWYQANRSSLSNTQNSLIVKASAEASIMRGDLSAARVWIEKVADENLRSDLVKKVSIAELTIEKE